MKNIFYPEDFVILKSIHDLEASKVTLDGDKLIFSYRNISHFDSIEHQNVNANSLDLVFYLVDIEDTVVEFRTHKSLMYSKRITLRGREYDLNSYMKEKVVKELPLQNIDILISWRNIVMINEGVNGRSTFHLMISKMEYIWE